jgi:hypothetical protein
MLMGTACCRIAGDPLVPVLDLGRPYVSDFLEPGTSEQVGRRLPLRLGVGPTSGLLQLFDTTPANSLYRHYWYRSGTNEAMRAHLAEVTLDAAFWSALADDDLVCDIGCNDGTLIGFWKSNGRLQAVGFDPAGNLGTADRARREGWTFVNDYFTTTGYEQAVAGKRAKVITSIAMFYDLDSPRQFCQQICGALHPEGLWICEMQYLPLVLRMNAFDAFAHEHLAVYSLTAFEQALRGTSLQVQRVSFNACNGGSIRIFITHRKRRANQELTAAQQALDQQSLAAARSLEMNAHLTDPDTYYQFKRRVDIQGAALREQLAAIHRMRKTVLGYGASTKGNTLLQLWGITPELLPAIAERDEGKWGRVTVGTEIPIISEVEMRARRPDYLLALPWHFASRFVEREEALVAAGTRFLVPLPTLQTLPAA